MSDNKPQIRFDNGAGYERYMGVWSRLVGTAFLDWLAPAPHLRWLDVGCGNGAFTRMLAERCQCASLDGIDPSGRMLEFARTVDVLQGARLREGSAMELPYAANSFDAAVMPLVIFFVPEPAVGVQEMTRVVAPGGLVSAYGWDMEGGFPYRHVREELIDMGFATPEPPSRDASRPDVMQGLWQGAELSDIASRVFTVQRTFTDFDDYWTTVTGGPSVSASLRELSAADLARLQQRLRERLAPDAQGRIVYESRANAIKGRVPA